MDKDVFSDDEETAFYTLAAASLTSPPVSLPVSPPLGSLSSNGESESEDTPLVQDHTCADNDLDSLKDDEAFLQDHLWTSGFEKEQCSTSLLCGIGSWRPSWLQPFASVYTFVTLVGLSYFMSGMAMKSLFAQIVSLERQFNIDSSYSGLFGSAYHLGYASTILFVGHFARVTHIPLAIGVASVVNGVLVMAPSMLELYAPYSLKQFDSSDVSSSGQQASYHRNDQFLCSWNKSYLFLQESSLSPNRQVSDMHNQSSNFNFLDQNSPYYNSTQRILYMAGVTQSEHFTSETDINTMEYEYKNTARKNASKNVSKISNVDFQYGGSSSEKNSKIASFAYQLLLGSLLLQGAISAFRHGALPYVYVDDNVLDKTKTGTYLAVCFAFGELTGPVGDLINGVLSDIPVDLSDTHMSHKDPRFISAWWLGFLFFGALSIVVALPLLLLPRRLVSEHQQRAALAHAQTSFGGVAHIGEEKISSSSKTRNESKRKKRITGDHPSSPVYCQLQQNSDSEGRSQSDDEGQPLSRNSETPRDAPTPGMCTTLHAYGQYSHHDDDTTLWDLIKDLPRSTVRIFKSPLYALLVVEMTIIFIPLSGIIWPFRVKYTMFEYNVSMATVNTAKGLSSAMTHIVGTLLGSFLSRKISTNMGYLRLILLTAFLSWILSPLLIYFGCDNTHVVGLNSSRETDTQGCECDTTLNLLACGSDDVTYLSPCFAGCSNSNGGVFYNCSNLSLQPNDTGTHQTSAVPGICDANCYTNFILFNVITATQIFIFSINNMPRHLLALRILQPQDRAFGSAMLHFAPYVSSLPAPYIFGNWMEHLCLVWSSDHCSLYDRDKLRYLMIGADIFAGTLTVLTYIAMVVICQRLDRKLNTTLQHQELEIILNEKESDIDSPSDSNSDTDFLSADFDD